MRLERVVDVYLRHVTVERGLSAHTTAAYRRDLRDYLAWLAGEGIDDIEAVTQAATNGYLAARAADEPAPAASTLARVQSSIRGLHRFAVAEGLAQTDPSARLRPRWLISAICTFSRTVIEAKVAVIWNVRPTPSRQTRRGGQPVMSRP